MLFIAINGSPDRLYAVATAIVRSGNGRRRDRSAAPSSRELFVIYPLSFHSEIRNTRATHRRASPAEQIPLYSLYFRSRRSEVALQPNTSSPQPSSLEEQTNRSLLNVVSRDLEKSVFTYAIKILKKILTVQHKKAICMNFNVSVLGVFIGKTWY